MRGRCSAGQKVPPLLGRDQDEQEDLWSELQMCSLLLGFLSWSGGGLSWTCAAAALPATRCCLCSLKYKQSGLWLGGENHGQSCKCAAWACSHGLGG